MNEFMFWYDGPVMINGRCVTSNWHGETRAISERKARSNLAYTYRRKHNLAYNTPIIFPNDFTKIFR